MLYDHCLVTCEACLGSSSLPRLALVLQAKQWKTGDDLQSLCRPVRLQCRHQAALFEQVVKVYILSPIAVGLKVC